MQNFSRVFSAQPYNLSATIITVETDITSGMYAFSVVGLPDKAVEEARDRVGSALKNTGLPSPKKSNQKTIVSLSPAEIKKEGPFFDVAIAIGYLIAADELHCEPSNKVFVGELALNGEVRKVRGILGITKEAKEKGFTEIYVPEKNKEEASLIDGITIYSFKNLFDLSRHLNTDDKFQLPVVPHKPFSNPDSQTYTCFSDVRGQEIAKRGLEIAAAGGHNIVMYGPPGTGKTMLAKAFAGILPKLTHNDALSVTAIHSVAGVLDDVFAIKPPFRNPHHTSSYVSVIGGGAYPKPGEVTLAHKGVLFLDEFPEFDKRVLESLREPLEDKHINISRAKGTVQFPTDFILVAAMNPPDPGASASQIQRHKRKISGPIMDRIDLWIPVEHIEYEELANNKKPDGEESSTIKGRVQNTRDIQYKRSVKISGTEKLNSKLSSKEVQSITLDEEVIEILNQSAKKLNLSPRAYHRIIKLSRTIADLENSPYIQSHHILEALQYRPKHDAIFGL